METEADSIQEAILELQREGLGNYEGLDNNGKPKTNYLKRLVMMDNKELQDECESKIWLSAYARNNIKSDYHWHCLCCCDECTRRGMSVIYNRAYKSVSEN